MRGACLACSGSLRPGLDLGRMPMADAFRTPGDPAPEYSYRLRVVLCTRCTLVQLAEPVAPELMFHADYPFLTGTSRAMSAHFLRFGRSLLDVLGGDGSSRFVVEIGGNDGTLLAPLSVAGNRVLNVEPSANVAQIGESRGVPALVRFFNPDVADAIRDEHGPADAIVAANVVCHIGGIGGVFEGVRRLLAPGGLFAFEDPYLGDILRRNAIDQFYDEHIHYFSLTAIEWLAAAADLTVIDVEAQATHGGSMRYVLTHRAAARPAASVALLRAREREAKLDSEEVWAGLRAAAERLRVALPRLLSRLRDEGRSLAGFAATAKSATTLNLCRIGPDLLPVIYDSTPFKHGRLTPGMHIPVRPYEHFLADPPNHALLLAWNHEQEIRAANRVYEKAGGRWISYIPEVRILL